MSVNKEVITYSTKRYVFSSSKPVHEVVATMEEWLNKEKTGNNYVWNMLLAAKSRDEIERGLDEVRGDRPFV